MDPVWVVSADMGYGHQRAVWPFRDVAHGGIIAAGDNEHASTRERALWKRYLRIYETFSRAKGIPLVGKQLFGLLDKLLRIPSMYPIRNLSASTFQVDMLDAQLRKGLGAGVMSIVERERRPLLTSFYVPALVANRSGYEPIYTIICDADLNRVWVAKEPWDSTINYFAPCGRAAQRLRSYGVPTERIFLTGFPLDPALLGGRDLPTLKHDLGIRLSMLDPRNRFHLAHGRSVEHFLGPHATPTIPPGRVLHITYAVGGAGAQKEIGERLLRSLRPEVLDGRMRVTLVAGTRAEVRTYFDSVRRELVGDCPFVDVLYRPQLHDYFSAFNDLVRHTDILWTKPSELSFYCGLGLPIIMSPTIGSQEKFNRKWLLETGAGMRQDKPEHAREWINELLLDGRFADMAWLGFLRARKLGTYHALDVIEGGSFHQSDDPLKR